MIFSYSQPFSSSVYQPAQSERQTYLLTFCLCFLLLVARGWARLLYPHLWAEDGIFFVDTFQYGWAAIFKSLGGYFHTIPRLIAYFFTRTFPLEIYPLTVALSCYLIYAAVAALFSLDYYQEYVESKTMRILFCILSCFLPGLKEMLGNLPNLHTVFFMMLWLIAIIPSRYNLNPLHIVLAALIALTSGESIVLFPLFALRAFNRWRATKTVKKAYRDILVCVLIIAVGILNCLSKDPYSVESHIPGTSSYRAYGVVLFLNLFLVPFLGASRYTTLFTQKVSFVPFFLVGFAGALLFFWCLLIRNRKQAGTILLAFVAGFLVLILTDIVRPGATLICGKYPMSGNWWWCRYFFLPAYCSLFLWFALMKPKNALRSYGAKFLWCLFFCYLGFSMSDFKIRAYGRQLDWQKDIKIFKQTLMTGCPPTVTIPIYPLWHEESWAISYSAKNKQTPCPDQTKPAPPIDREY